MAEAVATSILTTLLLTLALTAAGEALLLRRSRSWQEASESFLAGGGVATALFILLSITIPGHALGVLTAGLALAAAFFVALRLWGTHRTGDGLGSRQAEPDLLRDLPSLALLLLLITGIALFCVLDLRPGLLWDGYQIWGARARVIFYRGDLTAPPLAPGDYFWRILLYPPLLPLLEALEMMGRARFDINAVKPVFLPFFLSMLISAYSAVRSASGSRARALAACALVCFLPALSVEGTTGYADLPLAAYAAASVAAFLRGPSGGRRVPAAAWLVASMPLVKAEGTVLAALALLVAAGVRLREKGWKSLGHGAFLYLIPIAAFGLPLWVARHTVKFRDPTYGPFDKPHLRMALARVLPVARLVLREALAFERWGIFWPAFGLAAVAMLLRPSSPRLRALVLGVLLTAGAYAGIFFFTNWDIAVHVPEAYSRLLSQIAPAAAIAIVLWNQRGHNRLPSRP